MAVIGHYHPRTQKASKVHHQKWQSVISGNEVFAEAKTAWLWGEGAPLEFSQYQDTFDILNNMEIKHIVGYSVPLINS